MPIDNRLEILDFRLTLQMNLAILEFFRLEMDKRISKVVQAPGFIRGINPKSKIENPQAPAFIRGVNRKSKIENLKSIDSTNEYGGLTTL